MVPSHTLALPDALQSGRKPACAKRRTSRRRHNSSCSEDEEELEEDCWHDDDDDADEAAAAAVGEEQQQVEASGGGGRSHSGSGSGSQGYAEQDQQQDYASAVAAAAAAAAAGYGYCAAELQQPWVASLAAGMIHGALASAADPAAASPSRQQYQAKHQQQQHPGEEESDGQGSEDDAGDSDDAGVGRRSSSSRGGGSALQPPIGRFKSLPSKLGGAAARAAAAAGRGLKHTGSLPSNRPVPSSSCMSPGALFPAQCLHGSLNWSPGRLLLSPQRGGRGRGAAAGVDVGRDVNEEEAAGEQHGDSCTCSLGSVPECCAVNDR